jgi:hypothetical protein
MKPEGFADFDAVGEDLARTVQEAVPSRWSQALEVDRRRDLIRIKADLTKLKKHNFVLHCRAEVLELKTPKKRYRVAFRGLAPESEFSGTHLVITLRSRFGSGESGGGELGRATWRAVHAAKGFKRVFVTRALNAVADLAERNAGGSLEAATAASSDWEVLVRALSTTDVAPSSVSDPLANARLRGIHARRQLLQAEGGTIQASEAAAILGISRQAVDKRRQAGTLLAISVGGHGYHYPAWQFDQSGVIGGLESVLKALARHDEWMKLAFFVNANVRLNGESPLQRLRLGDIESVVDAASAYGEHGAA